MNKRIISAVKKVKKETKYFIEKQAKQKIPVYEKKFTPIKKDTKLYSLGKSFVKNILNYKENKKKYLSKTSSKEYLKENKGFFTKSNLKALFAYIFSDFSMEQIEDMIRYLFGDLSESERENVLLDILDHISNKEYGFLLKE